MMNVKASTGKCSLGIGSVVESGKRIVGNAGAAIIGLLTKKANLNLFNTLPSETAHPNNVYSLSDVVTAEIATMCCGDVSFEGIRDLRMNADFYEEALLLPGGIPSTERDRQRLDLASETEDDVLRFHNVARTCNLALIKGEELTQSDGYLMVDMDVSPFNEEKSHKENISMTYKRRIGYSPNFMYLGREGFMISTEMRPGKQHCQKGTPEFIEESIACIREIFPTGRVLLRMDSGNDAIENYVLLMNKGIFFICKRNLRKESPMEWLEHAKKYTLAENITHPREGKTVYVGSTWLDREYKDASGKTVKVTLRAVYEITERTMEADGQYLMPPSVEVNMFTTNTDLSDRRVIDLYHEHATCEQCHAELKSDLSFEKVPSGKYNTNYILNDLAMLAFNALRCIGMRLFDLKKIPKRGDAFRRRIGTVIRYMMHMPAMLVNGGGKKTLDLGGCNAWSEAFIYVFDYYKTPSKVV